MIDKIWTTRLNKAGIRDDGLVQPFLATRDQLIAAALLLATAQDEIGKAMAESGAKSPSSLAPLSEITIDQVIAVAALIERNAPD